MGTKEARLEEIRDALDITKTEMARMMGISPHYYYNIFNPKSSSSLRMEHLEKLMQNTGASPVWILAGEGPMFLHDAPAELLDGEPTEEEVERLYQFIQDKWPQELSLEQVYAVKLACAHTYMEHPTEADLEHLAFVAVTYRHVIVRVPGIDLTAMLCLGPEIGAMLKGEGEREREAAQEHREAKANG